MPNCPFLAEENNCGEKLVGKTFTIRVYKLRNVDKTKLIPYKCINIRRNVEKTKLILYEHSKLRTEKLRENKANTYLHNAITV